MKAVLPERQGDILRRVVEEYVATGQPVGSKTLVERAGLGVSPSTVRYELAELERLGLLTHPHTSAGRVPTEAGYRLYVDHLLSTPEPRPAGFTLDLPVARAEVEEALQTTTEMLSQVSRLLARHEASLLVRRAGRSRADQLGIRVSERTPDRRADRLACGEARVR